MELLSELTADHWAIRDFLKDLRGSVGEIEPSELREKDQTIRILGAWLKAHAEGEEKTCNEFGKRHPGLRVPSYEDSEEHDAIAILHGKLLETANPYLWQARLHLLCELVEHHLDEEEQEYFPLLRHDLSKEQSELLATQYRSLMQHLEPSRPQAPAGIMGWLSGRPAPHLNSNV